MNNENKECRMVAVDFVELMQRAMLAYDAAMSDESTAPAALGIATFMVSEGLDISIRTAVLMVKEAINKKD